MVHENHTTFRNHLERFISLSDEDFEKVMTYFSSKSLGKREKLITCGDYVTNTYWVKQGLLVSGFTDASGKEHILQFAIENCWITDQDAYYNQGRAVFTIECHEKTELLCLSFENRERLCADMHAMETFFRRKANDSFVKQQKRLLTYMTSDAKQRFELLLAEYPGLFQRLAKKTLAAYLGVSRETLSRFRD